MRADQRKHHIIYKTICIITGRWYIGMHSTDDLEDGYVGSGQRLWHSIKRHGKQNHICEILEHLPDRKSLATREAELVNGDLLKDPVCMNIAHGGDGGMSMMPRTPEWRANISKAHMGKKMSEEAIQNRLKTLEERNYKPSEETIAKQREGIKNSEKVKARRRALIIDGVTYEYAQAAIDALGLKASTLTNRLMSPNWLNYRWADQPEKDPMRVSNRARGSYDRK